MNITLEDYLEQDREHNLFYYINEYIHLDFLDMFPDDVLSTNYIFQYGKRYVTNSVSRKNINDVAKFLAYNFANNWNKYFTIFTTNFNYDKLVGTVQIDIKNETSNNGTMTHENSHVVSAFNEDDYSNDFKDTTVDNHSTNATKRNDNTRTKFNKGIDENLKLLNYLQKTFICDIVYKDINDSITKSIH